MPPKILSGANYQRNIFKLRLIKSRFLGILKEYLAHGQVLE